MTEQANSPHPQPEEGIEPDDLDTKMIVAIGLISTALLLASVLGVTAFVDYFQSAEVSQKVYERGGGYSYGSPEEVIDAQRNQLNSSPARTDQGGYTIPITLAKQLVVSELRASRAQADAEQANE